MEGLTPEVLERVAAFFHALAEPTRLRILNLLRDGERNVGEIAESTGFTSANISRHLACLTAQKLVTRESRGTAAYYRIADPTVFALCDLVCGKVAAQQEQVAQDARVLSRKLKRSAASP